MEIPKEVAEKVKKYECYMGVARSIFKDIENWIVDHVDPDIKVIDVFITQNPEGRCTADGDFIDAGEVTPGTYHGTYYHKISESQKNIPEYMGIDFVGYLFIKETK